MKIKPINSNNSAFSSIRFNKNIDEFYNDHFKGKENLDKKEYGNIVLLSLMKSSNYFDNISSNNAYELVDNMLKQSKKIVNKMVKQNEV